MTMRLAVARATVTNPDGTETPNATAETRGGNLVIRQGRTVVTTVEATAVVPLAGRKWEVTTADGVYVVARSGGCGCGR